MTGSATKLVLGARSRCFHWRLDYVSSVSDLFYTPIHTRLPSPFHHPPFHLFNLPIFSEPPLPSISLQFSIPVFFSFPSQVTHFILPAISSRFFPTPFSLVHPFLHPPFIIFSPPPMYRIGWAGCTLSLLRSNILSLFAPPRPRALTNERKGITRHSSITSWRPL